MSSIVSLQGANWHSAKNVTTPRSPLPAARPSWRRRRSSSRGRVRASAIRGHSASCRLYRESYAPTCWLPRSEPAPVRLHHGGPAIGHVTVTTTHNGWHHAALVIEDAPLQPLARELVTPGARVSLGATSISRYENTDLRLVPPTVRTL